MSEYHVKTGLAGIYAGILSKNGEKWLHKSDVTEETQIAVRDFMVEECLGGLNCTKSTTGGYQWKLKDGRKVELRITIKEKDDE